MKLSEYLASDGALTVAQLRDAIGVKSDAQVRQWQHAYGDRQPGPEYCVAIERATENKVRRWDLRPDDWHRIWPELIGIEGAPAVDVRAEGEERARA
jgi:DNA-binding transcriptional regulator YdaS (Cro superfamily)